MSTRFIRKRHRRVIPIGEARLRESYLSRGITNRHRSRYYPLYETAKTIYNYNNLLECLQNWNEYTTCTDENVKNAADILNLMGSYNESTKQNIIEATRIICDNILPYVEYPANYENTFSKLEGDKLQESKEQILDKLYILKECDRILENYKTLNDSFSVVDFFIDNLKVRSLSESLYRFCDKIEDFKLEYPANFCVAMESALYALDHIVVDELDNRRISEGVIDYYLLNGGNEDLNAFAESLDYCLQKDEFLPNEINDYMLYIQNVVNKDQIMKESVNEYFDNDFEMQMIDDYNNIIRNNAYEVVQEFQIFDKAKEILTKFKAAPNKTKAMVKEAINALFVTNRLQDMKKNTLNALSIIFYFVTGAGVAIGVGGLAGATLAFLVTLNLHHAVTKDYLKDAIEGWTKHKNDVERRIRNADEDERAKLSTYLEEVEKNLTLLTNKYETMRDETSDELSSKASADAHAHPSDDLTNPLGKHPLENNKKSVKEDYELLQEFKLLDSDQIIDKIKYKIKTELSTKDENKVKHRLAQLLESILFIGSIGIVMTAEFPVFINIIILLIAWTLIDILEIVDKSYRENVISTWKSHMSVVSNKISSAHGDEKSRLKTYLKALDNGLSLMKNAISINIDTRVRLSDFSITKKIDLLYKDQDAFIEKFKKEIKEKISKARPEHMDPLIFLILQITFMVFTLRIIDILGVGMFGEIFLLILSIILAKYVATKLSSVCYSSILSGFTRFQNYLSNKIKNASPKEKPIFSKFFELVENTKNNFQSKATTPKLGGN